MPKKFSSENTKAVEARERRKIAKDEAINKKQREIEDAYWKDDNKQQQKKQQKKEMEEKKREDALRRKTEAKSLLEKELEEVSKKTTKPIQKVTRAQISVKTAVPVKLEKEKKVETHLDLPLIENVNRLQIDGEEARTVDEALSLLGNEYATCKHPEKKMRAAYNAFEEKRLVDLKNENPNLRLSQLKQMIFKEWSKSHENPFNSQ